MILLKIGKVDSYQKGYLYYVDGSGNVIRMPPRGKRGGKVKVGKVNRPANSLCWVDGSGNVFCKKR